MVIKDISLSTPQENILYDEVLLSLAEQGHLGETLRFWESQLHFIVLGRVGNAEDDIYLERAKEDNIPILRRSSGGGTVVQGKGCFNFSLVLSKDIHYMLNDIHKSYRFILEKVVAGLKDLDVGCSFRPICDLAITGSEKKFSGNAQKRGKKFILHHGTILYQFELPLIERYLKIPKDIPEYRKGRTHTDFVTNIPCSVQDLKAMFSKVFSVQSQEKMSAFEQEQLDQFLKSKSNILSL